MSTWCAEIKTGPKPHKCLISATVVFQAGSFDEAEEQANAYAERLGLYDSAEVDSLYETAGAP
jgi:hypothetical protein